MSETKWTPGPWKADLFGNGRQRGFIRTVQGSDGGTGEDVARVVRRKEWGPAAYDANARLIASAPDLYAALAEAESVLSEDGLVECFCRGDFTCSGCKALASVRAALARARGEG